MYQPTINDLRVDQLMERLEGLDSDLADALNDAHSLQLTEYEERAVRDHGRSILAAIEGTMWAPDGFVSTADAGDSSLVRLMAADQAVPA